MLEETAAFLLEYPPLDEIGGPITDVIEMYRYGGLEKNQAIAKLVTNFSNFLQRYINQNEELNEFFYQAN